LNYRSTKGHRVQESGKASKTNIPKLASSLQRFLKSGNLATRDLRAIDEQISRQLKEEFSETIESLSQLRDRAPKNGGREIFSGCIKEWSGWLSKVDTIPGFAAMVETSDINSRKKMIDVDCEIFNAIISFRNSLRTEIEKSSFEMPNYEEIHRNSQEIFELIRQRLALNAKSDSSN
jgi:hypothetical protein